ncbi:hypothetical protein AM593_01761, partial [Mytilus galloprovincialis]
LSHDGLSTSTKATIVTDDETTVFHMVTAYPANSLSCNTTEFECDNGKCIANSLICNVDFDCYDSPEPPDRSDESTIIDPPCPEGGFKCSSGDCADTEADCPQSSSMYPESTTSEIYTEPTLISLVSELTVK